jgi:hypothetical protein
MRFIRQDKNSYQPALMLTHEEWVNGGLARVIFGAPPPASPARDTNPP